ncbi:hypothetical protein LVB77_06430 [Lysobacter sp. 5GHs7-4]|uniref:hypothetical protein n=1 Tax=Lysobacter sp. 5GHs7-4 TaxID=2904253 RepID=UPI001E31E8BF|nr:hypothetical protein [Lysobacter sp. 5GHs7-4]UHQ24328.1 hypothetical protein LVB77_06430 [Lysobacter sp. 5GHs7-4]
MAKTSRRFLLGTAAALLSLVVTACMASGPAKVAPLTGEGPFQQFIVKYKDGTAPAVESAVQARLDRTAAGSGLKSAGTPVKLNKQLRLSVGAEVFRADRALSKSEAETLMRAFGADPDVEYIEIDGIMKIMPVTGSDIR